MRGATRRRTGTLFRLLKPGAVALLTVSALATTGSYTFAAADTGNGAASTQSAAPTPKPTPSSSSVNKATRPTTSVTSSAPFTTATSGLAPSKPPALTPEQKRAQDTFTAEAAARAQAKVTGNAVPVDAVTTETTTMVANPDGSFSVSTALNPVRVEQNGAWIPIDPTLVLNTDGTVGPKATSLGITFSGGGTAPLALIDDHKGHVLTITWPSALPSPTLDGPTATYANVFPGVDLKMTAAGSTYSDVLVVHDAQAAANPALKSIHLGMSGPGLAIATDAAGGLRVADATGEQVFNGPPPALWDSLPATATPPPASLTDPPSARNTRQTTAAATTSDDSVSGVPEHYSVMPAQAVPDGIAISPDQGILTNPNTNFPVFIDPSGGDPPGYWAEIWSCSAWSKLPFVGIDGSQNISYPGNNGGTRTDVVRAGYYPNDPGASCPGPVRAMLEFDLTTDVAARASVNWAKLDLYEQHGPCTPTDIWSADPVDGNSGYPYPTWYNTATVAGFNQGSYIGTGACLAGNPNRVEFNVSSLMQSDLQKSFSSMTLGLRTSSEAAGNFEAFYVQNNGANNPMLNMNINLPPTFSQVWMDNTNGYLPKLPGANPSYQIHANVADTDLGHSFKVEFNAGNGTGFPASAIGTAIADPGAYGTTVSAPVPASWLQDGATYQIWARVTDQTSGLQTILSGNNPSYTAAFSPPKQPSITSGPPKPSSTPTYFPQSATGQQATVSAGTPVTNAFDIASALNSPNAPGVSYFNYVLNGDSSQAGPNTCAPPTQCGQLSANSGTNDAWLTINSAITHAGMNSLFVKAIDLAGNTSWNAEYDFFVPASFMPTVWGSVTGDQIPDIMAIAPVDPTVAGSPSHLVTFPTNLDPSKSVTQGWGGNWLESAPAANAPDGVSWAGTLITHRGADRVQPYDDLFAWKNGELYYFYNTLMSTANPSHSPVDAFAKTQESVITRPVCPACGPTYAPDWSQVRQILALGPAAGGVPGTAGGKTSLITVEDDGHQGANLWLFDPAGIGQLRNPRLIASCSIVIPNQAHCPSDWNWANTTLVAPGNADRHPAGADGKATSGLPDLWARNNNTGTLYMFPNRLTNGVEDPTGLGDFSTRVQLGGVNQFDARNYPSLFSNGNIEQGGNGLPDLWTLSGNGQLNLIQSPSSTTDGTPIPSTSTQTVSSAGWAGSYSLSTVDTSPLTPAAGPFTLTTQTGAQVCLDLTSGSTTNGNQIQTWNCNGRVNQSWTFASDGTVRWTGSADANGNYDKCLDIKADSTTNSGTFPGTPVQIWSCNTSTNGGGNQKWQIRLDPSGKGSLYNPASGLCLDDPSYSAANGTYFQIWSCGNGNNAQLWTFPGAAGTNLVTEAENLQIEPNPTVAPVVQTNCCGVTWSSGAQLSFPATQAQSTFTMDYYVAIAGTYSVAPIMTKESDYGTVQLSIDGNPALPNTFDGYSPTVITTAYHFGSTKLTVGTHKFTFTITGTNPASTGNRYMAGIDTLNLNWTTNTNPYLSVQFPASGVVGTSLTVDASASLGGANPIATYSFNFGDGSTPVTGTAPTAVHTYTTPGTYTATITITDSNNASTTASSQIIVLSGPAIANGDFETGNLAGWNASYNSGITTTNPHGGTYAGQINAPAGGKGSIEQVVTGLTPNTSYTLTGWVRTDGSATILGAKQYDTAGDNQDATTTATGWTQLTDQFTTGTTNTSVDIYCYRATAGTSACDDTTLLATPPAGSVANGDFETGNLAGWNASYNSRVTTNNPHGGTYAGQINAPAGGKGSIEQVVTGLTPNTSYTLTGWVRTDGSATILGAKQYDTAGDNQDATTTATGWTQLTDQFTTGTTNTSVDIYCYRATAGTSACDDTTLTKN
jgi:hypothetical protein